MIEKGIEVTTVIRCVKCGHPLRSPASRILKLGPACRAGLTETQLAVTMVQGVLW